MTSINASCSCNSINKDISRDEKISCKLLLLLRLKSLVVQLVAATAVYIRHQSGYRDRPSQLESEGYQLWDEACFRFGSLYCACGLLQMLS